MSRLAIIMTVLLFSGGCANVKPVVSKQPVEVTTMIRSVTPAFLQGERVYHAEMARDIAEYVLATEGVDCRGLEARVSFCEGIYTVSFRRESPYLTALYSVDIEAHTSKIMGIMKTRTKLAAL
jgi:hypothetical protein